MEYKDLQPITDALDAAIKAVDDARRESANLISIIARDRQDHIKWMESQPPPDWLGELLKALGWQGGTIHEAIQCVYRLRASFDARKNK